MGNPKGYASGLYREDGSVDEDAVAGFVKALSARTTQPEVDVPEEPPTVDEAALQRTRQSQVPADVRAAVESGEHGLDEATIAASRETAEWRASARMILRRAAESPPTGGG
jgi:hypothetical protein